MTKKMTHPTAIITIVQVVQTTSPSSNSPRTKTEIKREFSVFFTALAQSDAVPRHDTFKTITNTHFRAHLGFHQRQ